MIGTLFFTAIGYLLGSVSSAVIVCQVLKLPDPRQEGSKNPGASNVLRLGGKKAASMTLAGDALKGALPVLLASLFGVSDFGQGLVALAALIGHIFPVFFGFKGGKGVATGFGGIFGISIMTGLVLAGTWFGVAKFTKYASLASLVGAALAPLFMIVTGNFAAFLPVGAMTALIAWRHMENIERLRAGNENKIEL